MKPSRNVLIAVAAGVALLLALGAVWAWVLPRPQPDPAPETSPSDDPQIGTGPAAPPGERIVRVQCRQGACTWMRIVGIETVAAGPDGELRRLDYRSGSALDAPAAATPAAADVEWEARASASYAYCSTARPAYAFPGSQDGSGGLIAHHLDLFDLGGYQYASARLYGLICHDLAIDSEAEPDWGSLGYRPGTRSAQVPIDEPEALLTVQR